MAATLSGGAPKLRPHSTRRQGNVQLQMFRGLSARPLAKDNYAFVLVLIAISSLVSALGDLAPVPVPTPILFGATLIYTMRTSDVSRRLQTLAAALAIGGVGLAIVSAALTGRTGARSAIDSGVASLLVLLTLFGVGRRLVGHHEVSASTLAGALCIYLLVGLFFAFLFGWLSAMWIGPFFVSNARQDMEEFVYFSFSTLTTLSYGDLLPSTDIGHMLAVTEALFGQTYPATVIALLVSNFGRQRRRGAS
jgi:hypothetical protein